MHQPYVQLGMVAVQSVLAQGRGEDVSPATLLPPPIVVRRSCGCRTLRRAGEAGNSEIATIARELAEVGLSEVETTTSLANIVAALRAELDA